MICPSWEDLGEDEDVKKGRLSSNSISVDDDDIIVKRNDGLSITDKGSPNRIRQDSAESESGADGRPAGNQKKSGKPKIEGRTSTYLNKQVKPAAHYTI